MAARFEIDSAGKMFSTTGGKIGFDRAAIALIKPIARTHPFLTSSSLPCLQSAVTGGVDGRGAGFTHMDRPTATALAGPDPNAVATAPDAGGRRIGRCHDGLRSGGWEAEDRSAPAPITS